MVAPQSRPWPLTAGNVTADAIDWRRALERARTAGIRVHHQGDTWWATSATRGGRVYNLGTYGERCDCEAGQHGKLCTHRAAVVSAQVRLGTLAECAACGELLPITQTVEHYGHVGGVGEVLKRYCGPGYGHQVGIAAESRVEVAA